MTASGLAYWLVPEAPMGQLLARLIGECAAKGGIWFAPHVTLLGELQCDVQTAVAAGKNVFSGEPPLRLQLGRMGWEDIWSRCLYVDVELIEALVRMRECLIAALALPASEFRPHVSLMYGTYPQIFKHELVRRLERTLTGCEFDVRLIRLMSTDGGPADWYLLHEFELPERKP